MFFDARPFTYINAVRFHETVAASISAVEGEQQCGSQVALYHEEQGTIASPFP
jgi:hypothetical protein